MVTWGTIEQLLQVIDQHHVRLRFVEHVCAVDAHQFLFGRRQRHTGKNQHRNLRMFGSRSQEPQ